MPLAVELPAKGGLSEIMLICELADAPCEGGATCDEACRRIRMEAWKTMLFDRSATGANIMRADDYSDGDRVKAEVRRDADVVMSPAAVNSEGKAIEPRPVLPLLVNGEQKELRLNASNVSILVKRYGEDSEKWKGAELTLAVKAYPRRGTFQGGNGFVVL